MKLFLTAFLLFFSFTLAAQTKLKLPQASPKVKLTHTIGITEVTINYSAPGVKKREVWGKLVPYGKIWRAGANEATKIAFSTDVRILQENIPAGTYSFFIFPADSSNWYLVLNKQLGLWGTDGYDQSKDLIRLPFSPQESDFHETLKYSFNDVQPTSGRLVLNWEKKQLAIPIRVEVHAQTLKSIKDSLATTKPDDWSVFAQAVNYLLQQNTEHELALEWINKSIGIEENFYNTWLKARLLAQKSEFDEALELNKKAQRLGKNDEKTYKTYAQEIEDAAVLWKEKRFQAN
ncbi:hypothetical protein TH61_14790 [Rufibacter sp. DG15C]|uniref:DUF2911 domain-containing protein n=1 Tax=Rufibacter sp. DG15C TaxID=1379909 RepID=UPI00078C368A|nr:DUF2911 domain-containing protein [Rufibacter sp. DG15C]AMM52201.1 hypothetical protein TH61_14790 [Rufibacter sp. DG15C]